jgi:hypothetical protein
MSTKRRGWLAFGLAGAAFGWALMLVPAAFTLPAYQGSECGSGGCTSTSSTPFAVNGWWEVELLVGVSIVAATTLVALHLRCARGSPSAATVAWLGIALLAFFSFLSSASIGLLVFPTVLLLVCSLIATPAPEPPRAS